MRVWGFKYERWCGPCGLGSIVQEDLLLGALCEDNGMASDVNKECLVKTVAVWEHVQRDRYVG